MDELAAVRLALDLGWADPADHGAVGDGIADDTGAIQAAIDTGMPVRMRPGRFRVTSPLDLTLGTAKGATIEGAGSSDAGTVLVGDTGAAPVLDLTANQHTTVRGLLVKAGTTNPSAIGIMYARNSALWQSSYHSLENVTVYLGSDPTANNGAGTVGVYNVSAEILSAWNCRIRGDTGLWLDRTNSLSITSPYCSTQSDGQFSSMSVVRVVGGYLVGIAGPGLYAHQAADVRIDCGISSHGDPVVYPSAVVVRGGMSGFTWTGSVDGYRTAIDTDNWVTGLDISPYITPVAGFPIVNGSGPGAGLRQGVLRINPANGPHVATDLFRVDPDVGHGALWSLAVLAHGSATTLSFPHNASTMQSVRIQSEKLLDDWSMSCLDAQKQNVTLVCRDGTRTWGV